MNNKPTYLLNWLANVGLSHNLNSKAPGALEILQRGIQDYIGAVQTISKMAEVPLTQGMEELIEELELGLSYLPVLNKQQNSLKPGESYFSNFGHGPDSNVATVEKVWSRNLPTQTPVRGIGLDTLRGVIGGHPFSTADQSLPALETTLTYSVVEGLESGGYVGQKDPVVFLFSPYIESFCIDDKGVYLIFNNQPMLFNPQTISDLVKIVYSGIGSYDHSIELSDILNLLRNPMELQAYELNSHSIWLSAKSKVYPDPLALKHQPKVSFTIEIKPEAFKVLMDNLGIQFEFPSNSKVKPVKEELPSPPADITIPDEVLAPKADPVVLSVETGDTLIKRVNVADSYAADLHKGAKSSIAIRSIEETAKSIFRVNPLDTENLPLSKMSKTHLLDYLKTNVKRYDQKQLSEVARDLQLYINQNGLGSVNVTKYPVGDGETVLVIVVYGESSGSTFFAKETTFDSLFKISATKLDI